jgi:ferredoxin
LALTINEDCVACGVCEPECPVEAITEGDPLYIIDPAKCVECEGYFDSPKCAEVCPTDACVPA